MIDKFCAYLTKKIRKEMPEVDDERAEVIMYGLQNIIGELPKGIIILIIAYILGIFKLTVISILIIAPYRCVSGGVHMKTHIGCIIYTLLLYSGSSLLGKYIVLTGNVKIMLAIAIWIFCMIMIKLYAPADTENLPILRKKERKQKQILSYIIITSEILIAIFIKNTTISGIIIFGDFIQTLTITRIAYRVTHNKYGHEIYAES
ncbi:MAG: accessory gene regulator B family protein [Clostridia bacterium]|jgi:accessory gene regulator B|nr:accessory gene regulator B family protein [Clostridium sp.]MEE1380254.1 accessory gene regulator B family protein [Clostridia bacterium]CDE55392.1 accessory gene regulator B [Clostridium sp. CAG:269]